MAETISIKGNTKVEKYETLIPQLQALCAGESNLTANLALTYEADDDDERAETLMTERAPIDEV